MGEIVAGFGVPHNPNFPREVAENGPDCETARLYAEVAGHLRAVQPDTILLLDSDHLNTFFFNNLPSLAVGVAPFCDGPNDPVAAMGPCRVPIREELARECYRAGIVAGFDFSLTQEFRVDHSIMVPLHFLTPAMQTPIVPVFINGLCPPLPQAKRCLALGQMLRQTVEELPAGERVAVLASGSFSLEIGGPGIGRVDRQWMDTVLSCLEAGETAALVEQATTERMIRAGNVSGELLNWIALLGVVGDRRPRFLEPQTGHGHAYAAWRWD